MYNCIGLRLSAAAVGDSLTLFRKNFIQFRRKQQCSLRSMCPMLYVYTYKYFMPFSHRNNNSKILKTACYHSVNVQIAQIFIRG